MEKSVLKRKARPAILRFAFLLSVVWGLSSCLREDSEGQAFVFQTPERLEDGWEVSTPGEEGMDEAVVKEVLADFHTKQDWWQARSLLVVRNGRIVGEDYRRNAADRDRTGAVWSCTKQVLALAVFMAVEQGYIENLSVTVGDCLPTYAAAHPDKKEITLRQLLTMRAGIGYDNEGLNGHTNLLLRQKPENSVDYILSIPMRHASGEVFHYNDGEPHLVSAMLGAAVGMNAGEWCRMSLFAPLNIEDYSWLAYPDGVSMGAFGLMLRPRDLAKFGQLVLDGGCWNGCRLLSEASVDSVSRQHVSPSDTHYCGQGFGFYWWIDPERNLVYMHGQGGQYVLVNVVKRLVVVLTAEPNTQGKFQFPLQDAFGLHDKIAAAIGEE